jgi:hypothetical protein
MLAACESVTVLMLDGWTESKGIAAEIVIARQLGKTVDYRTPRT